MFKVVTYRLEYLIKILNEVHYIEHHCWVDGRYLLEEGKESGCIRFENKLMVILGLNPHDVTNSK